MSVAPNHVQRLRGLAPIGLALVVAGCATGSNRAPVETRTPVQWPARIAVAPPAVAATPPAADLPNAELAGQPGYYTVKPGDTLNRIANDSGVNWKDLVRWNNLENPNLIEVGQVLRVVAPGTTPGVASSRGVSLARVETRSLDPRTPLAAAPGPAASAAAATGAVPSPAASAPALRAAPAAAASEPAAASTAAATPRDDDHITWGWPVASAPAPYNESRAKGLVFNGKPGDPVLAAADGRVVYAGSGLRGYGNLVILKHNSVYLTAYAHNRSLLVKEDQTVRRGQKIAEMGSTDADSVQLQFELRRQGKPVDPTRLLPPR